MIEKVLVFGAVLLGYILAFLRPDFFSSKEMRSVVTYDGIALIGVIFTITTAAAVTINAKSLEILGKLNRSLELRAAAADLRKTMRRNTMAFFLGFALAVICFLLLNILNLDSHSLSESQKIASALLVMTFLNVLFVGFYLVLDVYRVTFGLLETEAHISGTSDPEEG